MVSIVVPVYRSEDNLEELGSQVERALGAQDYELILVNDQSPDSSWDVICRLVESNPRVVGINLRKNSGQDAAIMAGLRVVRGDVVVIMDDDLQHSPFDIPQLTAECEKGFDVCFADFPKVKQALWKNWGSALNGKIANMMIGKPKEVYLSPFKAVRAEVIREVVKYDGPYPYVDGLIFLVTLNVTQVPIEHHERFRGKSNYNLVRSIRVFLKTVTSFSILPLRVSSILGMTSAVLGFLLGLYYLVDYWFFSRPPEGWTTLVLINLVMGGSILVSIGVLGEYMGRAYLTLNKRPQQVVKEVRTKGDVSR